MKKAVAILLSVLMIISSISATFTFTASAETVNLFNNGDFKDSDLEANTATDWVMEGTSFNLDLEEGNTENLPEGEDFNILTFKRNTAVTKGQTLVYYRRSVKVQKNTDYKISFWVKNNGLKSFRYHMYEPVYIKYTGDYSNYGKPSEGQNIYSYDYAHKDADGNIFYNRHIIL